MTFLVANIPPVKCFVRKEFLYNHERGHGELEPCVWMTIKLQRAHGGYLGTQRR